MIKILDNLRGEESLSIASLNDICGCDIYADPDVIYRRFFDAIESEISERFELCPEDIGGNPIHSGDMLEGLGEVKGIAQGYVFAGKPVNHDCYETAYDIHASRTVRLEPDTCESIIAEIVSKVKHHGGLQPNELNSYVDRLKAVHDVG